MKQNIRRRAVALAVFVATTALFFIYQQASSTVAVEPQERRQTQSRRRRPRISAPVRTGRNYSLFKHESHRSGLKCSDCHKITSDANPDRISAATRTRIARGYPYHDSCFRCHRQQVYRGDRPVFCTVCHTRVSPLLTPRDVYSQFPNPKRGNIMAREFPGYFPHALHDSSDSPCERCHLTDKRGLLALPLKGIHSEESFQEIKDETFKTIPGEGESSAHKICFKCHWEKDKPYKDDCNGCHLTASDYKTGKNPVTGRTLKKIVPPRPFTANAETWFKNWPTNLPKRFSLKFQHKGGGGEHESKDCIECHTNVAQMTTLNIPKADVSIESCAGCHSEKYAIPVAGGEPATICSELKLKEKSGEKCVACHTTPIGREQPPDSHSQKKLCGEPSPTGRE